MWPGLIGQKRQFSNACHYSGEGEQVRIQVSRAENGGSGPGLTNVRIALELHGFTYQMENTADGIRFTVLMGEEEMSKIS